MDVAFLTYNPAQDIHHPIVKLDSTCYAGIRALEEHNRLKRKEKYQMGTDWINAYNHYKWYNSCLKLECQKLESGVQLKIRHWLIETGNVEAFKMQDVTYKAVSMIISPTVEYWYGSNQGPNALKTFGSRVRTSVGSNLESNCCGKLNVCDMHFEPVVESTRQHFKSPCKTKKKEREERCNSALSKAIDVLNQKKNILIHGSPCTKESKKGKGLKPIFEDHHY